MNLLVKVAMRKKFLCQTIFLSKTKTCKILGIMKNGKKRFYTLELKMNRKLTLTK